MDTPKSQLLDRAVTALATVFVGKRFDDKNMLNNGVRVYNQAIRTFAQLISRCELPVKEVLCANLIFQLYEVSFLYDARWRLKYMQQMTYIYRSSTALPVSLVGWRTWRVPMLFLLNIIRA